VFAQGKKIRKINSIFESGSSESKWADKYFFSKIGENGTYENFSKRKFRKNKESS